MGTFINVDIDHKTSGRHLARHALFTFIWLLGLVNLVRIDMLLFGSDYQGSWFEFVIPTLLVCLIAIVLVRQKWYYNLALLFYPVLAFGWFIPKAVLRTGKIYLFARYIDLIYKAFRNFRSTILWVCMTLLSLLFLFVVDSKASVLFASLLFTTVYVWLFWMYIKGSFKQPELFGNQINTYLVQLKSSRETTMKFLQKTILIDDGKAPQEEIRNKQLERLIILNYILTLIEQKLNSFSGKRAYAIAQVFEVLFFLFVSIFFFWFLNVQLYRIDPTSFSIDGTPTRFEFLYYTLKTITFSESSSISPLSVFAKAIQMASFFTLGIILLVISVSLIYGLRQERIMDNVKLTSEVCKFQNSVIEEIVFERFKKDMATVLAEVKSIKDSLNRIAANIDRMF